MGRCSGMEALCAWGAFCDFGSFPAVFRLNPDFAIVSGRLSQDFSIRQYEKMHGAIPKSPLSSAAS
jgi:hypothetical protein